MKKLSFVLLLLLLTTTVYGQTRPSVEGIRGTFSKSVPITQAHIDSVASHAKRFVITEPITVSESVTFPATITVVFAPKGSLAIPSGVVVTFNGPIEAGAYQIFSGDGAGDIVMANGATPFGYPEWWGGGNGVSGAINQVAFQHALNIVRNVKLGRGLYYITSGLSLPSTSTITGESPVLTTIITATAGSEMIKSAVWSESSGYTANNFLKNFSMNGGGVASAAIMLGRSTLTTQGLGSINSAIDDVYISQCKNGIIWYGAVYNELNRCKVLTTGSAQTAGSVGLDVRVSQYLDVTQLIIEGFEKNISLTRSSNVTLIGGNSYTERYTPVSITRTLLFMEDTTRCGATGMIFEWNESTTSYPLVAFSDTSATDYRATDNYLKRCYLISLDDPPTSGQAMIQVGGNSDLVQRTYLEDNYLYPKSALKEHIRIASASMVIIENTKVGTGYSTYNTALPTIVGNAAGAYSRTVSLEIPQLVAGAITNVGIAVADLATFTTPIVTPEIELTPLLLDPYIDTTGPSGFVGLRIENPSGGTIATQTVNFRLKLKP